jgi:preprotein translocase subunit YajC
LDTRLLLAQNVPPAPGRQTGEVQVHSTPGPAPTAAADPPAGGMWVMLLMVVPLLLFMFWSTRSAQKKQEKTLGELAKGDRVILQGGLVGKFVEMNERLAKVELAPGLKVDVLRSSILGKDNAETQATAEKRQS